MKKTALVIALLMSSPAIAQTTTEQDATADPMAPAGTTVSTAATPGPVAAATNPTTVVAVDVTPGTSSIAWPSNADPELSARGIPVISDPAVVPPGWNGLVVAAVGGPIVGPASGEVIEAENSSYPPCTAEVTDNCVQTYAQPD